MGEVEGVARGANTDAIEHHKHGHVNALVAVRLVHKEQQCDTCH